MRYSRLFLPTLREVAAEVEMTSHRLLLRAGFIRQLAAGIYSYLPLGWRTLDKISDIIRDEMNRAGAQELLMPALHPQELWAESGREETMHDVLLGIKDRSCWRAISMQAASPSPRSATPCDTASPSRTAASIGRPRNACWRKPAHGRAHPESRRHREDSKSKDSLGRSAAARWQPDQLDERSITMPEFGSPFSGLAHDKKLTEEELVRAVRFMIAAEYEAIQLYMQLAESTDNQLAAEVLKDIADEERVHAGEFLRLLYALAPDEERFYAEGAKEVEEEIAKAT